MRESIRVILSSLNSNTQSATATAPLGPTIKILKRPQSNKNLLEGNNNNSANSGQTQSKYSIIKLILNSFCNV